ncbi:hypothetical protein PENTCL1PPCAC_20994, partial [Pristionchus entomophagus]
SVFNISRYCTVFVRCSFNGLRSLINELCRVPITSHRPVHEQQQVDDCSRLRFSRSESTSHLVVSVNMFRSSLPRLRQEKLDCP